jgi:hypothetical protein
MKPHAAFVPAVVLALGLLNGAVPTLGQELVSPDDVSRALVVRNLQVSAESVSGVLINKTLLPLAEVRLLVRHTFLWKKERAPQTREENPGRAVYFDVPGTIPAAGVVAFTYKPDPPLPDRPDGRFETTVEVVGFNVATGEDEESTDEGEASEEGED